MVGFLVFVKWGGGKYGYAGWGGKGCVDWWGGRGSDGAGGLRCKLPYVLWWRRSGHATVLI